jgi:hypothetical protein
MVRTVLFALGVILLSSPASLAQSDPVRANLDKAKAAYDEQLDKLRAGLLKSLDEREESARKAGDKKLVDQVKAERDAFESRGELPKVVPTANHLRDAKAARTALETAYTAAIKEYVKAKKDDEAAAAERDLAAFKDATGATGVSLSALLAPNSAWAGVRRVATAKGKLAETPFQMTVSARDGKAFKGEITLDKNRKYAVEGLVEGDRIAFATTAKGKFKNTFEGRLRGGIVELVFAGTGSGGDQVRGAVVLGLARGNHPDGPRRFAQCSIWNQSGDAASYFEYVSSASTGAKARPPAASSAVTAPAASASTMYCRDSRPPACPNRVASA